MDIYANWENMKEWANEPIEHDECGCAEYCHKEHVFNRFFEKTCELCDFEKCGECVGKGMIMRSIDEEECEKCGGTGRIR